MDPWGWRGGARRQEFADAVDLYYWLAPGVYALGLASILAQHYAGRGSPPVLIAIWAVGLIVNLAINLIWLEAEGTYIASLSSSVAYGLVLLLLLAVFIRDGAGAGRRDPRAALEADPLPPSVA